MNSTVTPEIVREQLEAAFYTLDIPTEVERHTGTRLHPVSRTGKQYGGACPFSDCLVDTDGFSVWSVLTPRGKHYFCRGCKRSGDIMNLVQEVKGLSFSDVCQVLGIQNPYLDDSSNTNLHSLIPFFSSFMVLASYFSSYLAFQLHTSLHKG